MLGEWQRLEVDEVRNEADEQRHGVRGDQRVGLVGFGILIIPRFVRGIFKLERDETTLVGAIGLCFACAFLAYKFGYSVALGAFIGGSLVAESGESLRIEMLVHPVRDMFVAIFFVSVGSLIDPRVVLDHWGAVLALSALVITGKIIAVSAGSFITGNGLRASVQAGMSLAQIGEFSFIIAAVIIGGASLWVDGVGHKDASKEASWQFVKYLVEPATQAKWHTGTGYFPNSKGALNEPVDVEYRIPIVGLRTALGAGDSASVPSSTAPAATAAGSAPATAVSASELVRVTAPSRADSAFTTEEPSQELHQLLLI